MQYLNSYFILNISGKEKKKRKQKNSTIKDIERVNYFAHNFSISHKVCLVEKKKWRGWSIYSTLWLWMRCVAQRSLPYVHTIFITTNNNGYLCRPEISSKPPEEIEMIAPISKLYNLCYPLNHYIFTLIRIISHFGCGGKWYITINVEWNGCMVVK